MILLKLIFFLFWWFPCCYFRSYIFDNLLPFMDRLSVALSFLELPLSVNYLQIRFLLSLSLWVQILIVWFLWINCLTSCLLWIYLPLILSFYILLHLAIHYHPLCLYVLWLNFSWISLLEIQSLGPLWAHRFLQTRLFRIYQHNCLLHLISFLDKKKNFICKPAFQAFTKDSSEQTNLNIKTKEGIIGFETNQCTQT